MPSPRDEFVDHCLDLLGRLGPCRARRMFGGHGIDVGDVFIAIVANEQLFLKVDAPSQPAFEAAGCRPFTYEAKGKRMTMAYWSAPDEAMDSAELMSAWGHHALDAALRARTASTRKTTPPIKPVVASRKILSRRP